jgi:hypothetical protein
MAKELSDLFNANRLRVLWNQSGQAGSGAAPTHNSPEPAATKLATSRQLIGSVWRSNRVSTQAGKSLPHCRCAVLMT